MTKYSFQDLMKAFREFAPPAAENLTANSQEQLVLLDLAYNTIGITVASHGSIVQATPPSEKLCAVTEEVILVPAGLFDSNAPQIQEIVAGTLLKTILLSKENSQNPIVKRLVEKGKLAI